MLTRGSEHFNGLPAKHVHVVQVQTHLYNKSRKPNPDWSFFLGELFFVKVDELSLPAIR